MKAKKSVNWVLTYYKMPIIGASCFVLLTVSPIPLALGDPSPISPAPNVPVRPEDNQLFTRDSGNNPHQSAQKFKQYLKEKYKDITEANSRIRHTAHGPSGDIFVIGDIAILKKPDLKGVTDKHARARIIAKAFMDDEASLFNIVNPNEIHEYNILDGTGIKGDYTIVYYRRYINDVELQDSELDIEVGLNENIRSFSARLVAVPPELNEATKKKTLSEEEIKAIIESDLTEVDKRGRDLNKMLRIFKKIAITSPPYIIWVATDIYTYRIDAFTGKILMKERSIIPFRSKQILQKEK